MPQFLLKDKELEDIISLAKNAQYGGQTPSRTWIIDYCQHQVKETMKGYRQGDTMHLLMMANFYDCTRQYLIDTEKGNTPHNCYSTYELNDGSNQIEIFLKGVGYAPKD